MKVSNIEWHGKRNCSQAARKTGNMDVTIKESVVNDIHKARFTFRNGVANILSETDYVQFGIPNTKKVSRIYFMTGTSDNGLKMTTTENAKADNRYVTINRESDAVAILPFAGDYELLFDDECGLYYIQK